VLRGLDTIDVPREVNDDVYELTASDLVVVSRILHDWDDERALLILRNSARAIERDGRLLVVESLMTPCASHRADTVLAGRFADACDAVWAREDRSRVCRAVRRGGLAASEEAECRRKAPGVAMGVSMPASSGGVPGSAFVFWGDNNSPGVTSFSAMMVMNPKRGGRGADSAARGLRTPTLGMPPVQVPSPPSSAGPS
jgi:hypothetical protein